MSRSTRQQKSEAHLKFLEAEFSTNLIAALRECAGGTWGMFGRNDGINDGFIIVEGRTTRAKGQSTVAEELERLPRELGFTEPFQPFKRFLEYRQMRGSNVPGEPKLALQFLEELGVGPE